MNPPAPIVERRKFARKTPTIHAFVHCRGRFQHTRVTDYAAGGMQVSGTFGLHKGDPVEIELMSGTRLAGRVAWSLGERTGIEFLEPLEDTHPGLIEMASASAAAEPSEPPRGGARKRAPRTARSSRSP
jgi:hypothetical protein